MHGVRGIWSRGLHTVASAGVAVLLFVLLLSVVGFVVTTRLVNADRSAAADRSAENDAAQVRGLLQQALTFSTGLASALEGESGRNAGRFKALEGSAATAVGLTQAMWVEPVTSSGRSAYERRIGAPITRLPGTRPAGAAATYLPATFVTGLPLRPGVDVSGLPALAATLRNPLAVFAGTATPAGTVAGQRGFFMVQEARFGQGEGSSGFLVVFVPAGWLNSSLGGDSNQIAISQDGRRLAGTFDATPAVAQPSTRSLRPGESTSPRFRPPRCRRRCRRLPSRGRSRPRSSCTWWAAGRVAAAAPSGRSRTSMTSRSTCCASSASTAT